MPLPAHIRDDKYKIAMSCEWCGKRIAQRLPGDPLGAETMAAWTLRRKEFIRLHWDCPKSRLDEERR